MKIVHLREKCIGCNSCIENAPDYWTIADDGKATLKHSVNKGGFHILEITEIDLEKNEKASSDCPMNIIRILKDSHRH